MEHEHLIFFIYTVLNTLSRVVARQVSVRLERRMYGSDVQGLPAGGVAQGISENEIGELEESEVQDEETV